MRCAKEPFWWYELRDLLRREFIRSMKEGRSFPQTRQHLLDHVEDTVARWERAQLRSSERRAYASVETQAGPDRPDVKRK